MVKVCMMCGGEGMYYVVMRVCVGIRDKCV